MGSDWPFLGATERLGCCPARACSTGRAATNRAIPPDHATAIGSILRGRREVIDGWCNVARHVGGDLRPI